AAGDWSGWRLRVCRWLGAGHTAAALQPPARLAGTWAAAGAVWCGDAVEQSHDRLVWADVRRHSDATARRFAGTIGNCPRFASHTRTVSCRARLSVFWTVGDLFADRPVIALDSAVAGADHSAADQQQAAQGRATVRSRNAAQTPRFPPRNPAARANLQSAVVG